MSLRLLRVNNKLNIPLTGSGATTQATYSTKSQWEASLNYPLALPRNARIGLLDCLIELPNDYIIVPTDENDDMDYVNVRITIGANRTRKAFLVPGRYNTQEFKNMLEWSLNGAFSFFGITNFSVETGFNFSCPTYEADVFKNSKQPILKIQWDRSDPFSTVDEVNLDLYGTTFDDLNSSISTPAGPGVLPGTAQSKQYFTKGAGIMQATLTDFTGTDPNLPLCTIGLQLPALLSNDIGLSYFIGVVVASNGLGGYKYFLLGYPIQTISANNYFNSNCIYDYPISVNLTNPVDGENLQLFTDLIFGGISPNAFVGDTIQIISTTTNDTRLNTGGYITVRLIRGGNTYVSDVQLPKPSFLQWDIGNVDKTLKYLNPNDGIERDYNLSEQNSIKDLIGCWSISQYSYTLENLLFTVDPFHVIDTENNTQINLRDVDIDLRQPVLRDIIAQDVFLDFRKNDIWKNLMELEQKTYTFRSSVRGQIIGLKPIDYGRLRFPINILIDNIDLDSYDTSIKDKENLLFCLSESNLATFDIEGDILAVKYTCQNEPLMISLRNDRPVVLNRLKFRLTDNYYNTFTLNPLKESHFNILVSTGKTFGKLEAPEQDRK
jgi:hypothetical protein